MSADKKTLVLYNSVPYFLPLMSSNSVIASWILRDIPFYLKVVRKLMRIMKLPQVYWYAEWKKEIMNLDKVVIFAPMRNTGLISYLKKENPHIRIIYWFWNPVIKIGFPDESVLSQIELWSFDPGDCLEYNMKFNTTFYFNNIELSRHEAEYDAVFLGQNKGRRSALNKIQEKLNNLGLRTEFQIIENPQVKIDYGNYLSMLSKSKAIVDVVSDGQSGLTVRPMESIFLEKKLITDDNSISAQDFYNPKNIFIVGRDNEYDLLDFINSPYESLNDKLVNKYDFKSWLKRFEDR